MIMHIASKSIVVLFLCLGVFFAQCSKKTTKSASVNMTKPDEVALAFTKHLANLELEKAKAFASADAQQLIDMISAMTAGMAEEELNKSRQEAAPAIAALKSAKCTIEGDEALCYTCCDVETGLASEDPILLKKIDNKWFVHFSKEDMMMDGEGEMPETGE